MFYLIYISSSLKLMDDHDLLFLLQKSREKNLRLGITGMLLYKEGNFMQMIEGEKQTVLDLYDEIKKDNRHHDVFTILTGDIKQRNFENWSMGFSNMDKAGEFPKYDNYIKEGLTSKSFEKDARKAYKFMLIFNEVNR